ncbi:hypothetical protein [Sulfitobacter pontiacus]|uniref:hypothetical protein n=1 Tax=Sulfitobacter pontiacus TaxID=60137 RepID=UPI001FADBEB4|nr:hypothetical protein [Sulfitobacter pontiacus]
MTNLRTKKDQLKARHNDELARLREAERKQDSRRKYILGNLIWVLRKHKPDDGDRVISAAAKLASRDHDRAELAKLKQGAVSQSRIILLGALLLAYAERAPLDRRIFDMLRPFARPKDRELLADVFVHYDRYRPPSADLDTSAEAAARSAEKADRRIDSVRLAAIERAAREGLFLPVSDDDDDGDGESDLGGYSARFRKISGEER